MIELKNCPICSGEEWENMDHIRDQKYWYDKDMRLENEPVSFKICKRCGFVTYDYKSDEELSEAYDSQRSIMQAGNIITCNRKNEYHEAFLGDVISASQKVLDVGCAQGSFLSLFPFSECYGTEWSEAFAAFAKNEYGVRVSKEINESRNYDLITYYHVLEHVQNPDKELEKIRPLLTDDGYLYISVPVFFDILDENSGSMCSDFESLFHLNHVNIFSKQSFYNLLNNAGFTIVKENETYYGHTVLCKKNQGDNQPIILESWETRKEQLERYHHAIQMLNAKDIEGALQQEPLFPDAYMIKSVNTENMKNFDQGKEILEKGLKLMPDSSKINFQYARLLFQWDEQKPDNTFYSNNIRKAEELFLKCLELKPGNEDCYYFLGLIAGKYKKDYKKAVNYLKESLRINPTKFVETWNIISYLYKEMEQKS